MIKDNKNDLIEAKTISNEDYLIIQRTLKMFVKSTNLSYPDRFKGFQLRDELMAENLIWLLDEIYPDKKNHYLGT